MKITYYKAKKDFTCTRGESSTTSTFREGELLDEVDFMSLPLEIKKGENLEKITVNVTTKQHEFLMNIIDFCDKQYFYDDYLGVSRHIYAELINHLYGPK